jgi:F420-0:gamma-glutamyl ligase-like protein
MVAKNKSKNAAYSERFMAIPIRTKYIRKNEDFVPEVIKNLRNLRNELNIKDGDIIVLSEKFISTSEGNFVDEKNVKPSFLAYFCYYWSKYIWGYILGPILKTRKDRIMNLRKMPKNETIKHKQVVINNVGLIYALKPASEGGVDLTNVPGSYASLLPKNPKNSAERLYYSIKKELNLDLIIIIIDTDATYRFFKWYLTALPYAMNGIISKIGVIGYVLGKLADLLNIGGLCGATPLTIVGNKIYLSYSLEELLYISNLADTSQVPFTKSIHDMMKKYNTFEITEDILSKMNHTPIVIIKDNNKIK